jgi:hypothetical protein
MDDEPRRKDPMVLELRALCGGAYTQVALRGSMATVPQGKQARRLLELLCFWHGAPVDVVVCIGMDTGGWLEVWDEALSAVPTRVARIGFRISRDTLLGASSDT